MTNLVKMLQEKSITKLATTTKDVAFRRRLYGDGAKQLKDLKKVVILIVF
jgi:hypothetical protein